MITPKDMEKFTNNQVVKMYEKLNQDLTKTIIRQLRKDGDISSFTRSQIRTLKQIGGNEIFKQTVNKMAGLTKKQKKEINNLFDEIGNKELQGYEGTYKTKGLEFEISPAMMQILKHAKKISNKDLRNLTGSVAYKTKRTYINAIDRVYKEVATGAYDYNTSIKRAVNELAEKGITLTNKAGRNEQLDVAVKRALYGGIQQTANDLARQVGEDIDYNCVVIGHSDRCRPSHNVIDAVTMSKKEFENYEYLTEEYNCNHIVNYDWQPEFEDGRKRKEYSDEHLSDAVVEKNYKMHQKANYFARQVRTKKNNIVTDGDTKKNRLKLRIAQKKYREYCKKNGLEVDYSRTWKTGYNK